LGSKPEPGKTDKPFNIFTPTLTPEKIRQREKILAQEETVGYCASEQSLT
jgi:hypothetical protein